VVAEPFGIPLRQAKAPLILALDIGTSGLRALAFDSLARPIRTAGVSSDRAPRLSTRGEASLDPAERSRAAFACIDRVMGALGRRGADVAAVSVSAFWHSLMGVDAQARPTTRVITWADTRPRGAAAVLRRELDEEAVHARTGCMLHASYFPAKLRWLGGAEPDSYRATAHWMSFGEYLYLRVFGERRAAHGMASATGLYTQSGGTWDAPMLGTLALDERTLSPISDDALQGLRPTFARRWPALARVPWIPAIGDGACSNLGTGGTGAATATLTVGTSAAIRVIREVVPPTVRGGWTYRLDQQRIIAGGALSNGGNAISWVERIFPSVDLARLARRPVDAHGLTALPLLAGDRSPTWDDTARGTVAGLTLGTSQEDIAQAFLEGIVLRFGRLWDLVDAALPGIERVVVSGGVALSRPYVTQLLADTLGKPLIASGVREGSARGAAIVALERIGAIEDLTAAAAPLGRTFRPRMRVHEVMRMALVRQAALEGGS